MKGVVGFVVDHYPRRYLVSPTFPILIEIEDNKLPFSSVANNTPRTTFFLDKF